MRLRFRVLLLPLALAACGAAEPVWAPQSLVESRRYVHGGPPTITLFTVIETATGDGAHASLMINGAQRVLFDPAGTFAHPSIPERNDVIYGMSPRTVDYYTDYHARKSYHVVAQTVEVSPAVAARALALAVDYGAVPKAMCARAVTDILGDLPGFESIGRTWFPARVSEDFAVLPGVTTREVFDFEDADDNAGVLIEIGGDPAFQ